MQQQDSVTSLEAKLIQAMDEIKALKEQVEQLQDQLSEKDGLLKKETRKHRNRFRAYVDCLSTLTECQANCERLEAGLHQEPPQPETSWGRQVEVEQENQLLKEEVDLLKVGQRRLEDELMTKNQLILSANEKKRAQTSAYIDCLALLTTKEQELKKSLAEVGEIKAHKDGSSFLKEQVEQLQKQLSEKDGLLKKETRKHRNRFRAYVDCLSTLTECQANCERLEAGLHQEPPQPETSWGRQVEVEEENQLLKEEVDLLKVGQRRLEDELMKLHQTRSERLSCRMVEAETIWSREDEVVLKEQLNLRTAGQRRSR